MSSFPCPCQSGSLYENCCAPLHQAKEQASTPEQLMRSRYSAFCMHLWPYLIKTHHPQTRRGLTEKLLAQGPHPRWLALDVLQIRQDGAHGQVTFKAWYQDGGKVNAIYECSDFVNEDEQWFYTTGEQMRITLPGGNEPCICKNGKKFKQCCGR
ncbi:MAG: YchJ family protein [Shewanella sp.]|nr:YchJ family protein [Shewanella sp.]MCF1430939.1 YchJ family protein [Shewanella sp.]MCF1457081.1 YchJ family protein [Shewanella sp.]